MRSRRARSTRRSCRPGHRRSSSVTSRCTGSARRPRSPTSSGSSVRRKLRTSPAPKYRSTEASMSEPIVRFVGIGKAYAGVSRVVDDLNLDIERGEFLTLLGPSGSGKTTTLMMLAGFETPTEGDILIDGKSLSDTPPHQRGLGFVFQNYALFPHM